MAKGDQIIEETEEQPVDPRRNRPLEVHWVGNIGRISIDGEAWAAVEWSSKHECWCIEDAAGRCLRHTTHIRGQAESKKTAVELATAMIRDGRMPSPEEAQGLSMKPANVLARQKRKEQRQRTEELRQASWNAASRDAGEAPLWECLAEAFDFADPSLWRSNSFASLRPRLVIHLQRIVAGLEHELDYAAQRRKPWGGRIEPAAYSERRVARIMPELVKAREILALLKDASSNHDGEVGTKVGTGVADYRGNSLEIKRHGRLRQRTLTPPV
jgi:hypothetical protein